MKVKYKTIGSWLGWFGFISALFVIPLMGFVAIAGFHYGGIKGIFLGIVFSALVLFLCIGIRKVITGLLATLTVTNEGIVWKCFTHKRIELKFDECEYIGVADQNSNYKWNGVPQEFCPPDMMAFIYFSVDPFPQKYRHSIASRMKINKRFVMFTYSKKLCEHLMEVLPPQKTGELRAMYFQVKRYDEEEQRKKEKRKKERERKKSNRT